MTEQEKYYLESAKQTAKAAIRCRRDLSEQQKQEARSEERRVGKECRL